MRIRPAVGCGFAVLAAALAAPRQASAAGDITLVSGGSLDFGDVALGSESTTQPVEVRNDSVDGLAISAAYVAAGDADSFVVSGESTLSLAEGETATWVILCQPQTAGPLVGTFVIDSSDDDTPQLEIALSCNGVPPPLAFSPAPFDFGVVRVGDPAPRIDGLATASTPLTIEVLYVDVSEVTVESKPAYPLSLGEGEALPFSLTWSPTADIAIDGAVAAVTTEYGTISVPLTGTAVTAAAALSTDSVDFGTLCTTASTSAGITLTSTGTATFYLTADSPPAAPFAVLDPVSPGEAVDPGGARSFTVTFAPTATGVYDDGHAIASDIPGATDFVVLFHGEAIDSGLGVSPAQIDFGEVDVGAASAENDVTISNCGGVDVAVSSVQIAGDDAGEFRLTGTVPPPDVLVAPGGAASWTVAFLPTGAGARAATLEIVHGGGTASIPLGGTGVDVPDPGSDAGPGGDAGPGDDGAGGDTSYYACNTGGAAGGASLALALLCILLATRRSR